MKFWEMTTMLSSLSLSEDINLNDRIRAYEVDRDERLEDLFEFFPRLRGLYPAELVENVLTDVCLYFIQERPLPRGQMALCSVATRRVLFNSKISEFVDSKRVDLLALRRCTMAHELGHVRLHQDEMDQSEFISFQGNGHFRDSRAYQKEEEADLYAQVFLVPLKLLEKTVPFRTLLDARAQGRAMSSGKIWVKVYQLSTIFRVTPTLMCRSLQSYGWIAKERSQEHGLHRLRLLEPNSSWP